MNIFTKFMRFFVLSFFFLNSAVFAQNVAVNSTGNPPDASAILDLSSTVSGILIPRMTQTQRDNIVSPSTGLLIYQTDNLTGFYFFNGSSWTKTGTVIGSGTATRIAFWNAAGSLSSDNQLYWDNTNKRLGIGTSLPYETLHINGSVRGNQSGALRISTGYGWVDIGPKNTSWSHFMTSNPRFYFDKGITVNEGLVGSYNENLQLQTSGTTRITILNSNGYVGIGKTPGQRLDVNGYVNMNNGYAVGTNSSDIKITYGRITYGILADGLRHWGTIPHGLSTVAQILVSLHRCSDNNSQVLPSGIGLTTFISGGTWYYCIENNSGSDRNIDINWMAIGNP